MSTRREERRRFLVAALALAGAAATQGPDILGFGRAWAGAKDPEAARQALVKITRLLYPHDALGDAVYAEVLDQTMVAVANDGLFGQLLADAEAELDASVGGFLEATPAQQLAALQATQFEPYFTPIQYAVANRLYSHPKTWALLGYEGPSWQQGGWIERGAGVIDWLAENGS